MKADAARMTLGTTPAMRQERGGNAGSWMAFVAMAFAVVGLTGVFATYALPIPMQRAVLREAALDDAAEAARAPDPEAALAPILPRLGDSAAPLTATPKPDGAELLARIARERIAMRERLLAEQAEEANRLRWLSVVITVMGALFGCAVVGGLARRAGTPG